MALTACRASVAGQGQREGPQLVPGFVEQGFRVGPGLADGPGGPVTSLPGRGCLDAQVRGGGFQLPDQLVYAGGGPASARRGHVA